MNFYRNDFLCSAAKVSTFMERALAFCPLLFNFLIACNALSWQRVIFSNVFIFLFLFPPVTFHLLTLDCGFLYFPNTFTTLLIRHLLNEQCKALGESATQLKFFFSSTHCRDHIMK